ncbi:MAG: DUF2147 domain-containing protein [Tatlockia sp.]|nr:DUF2147 domain-containing protein [Tatlockia sp.]
MNWKTFSIFLITFFVTTLTFAKATPAGNWTTIDDKTEKKRAVVHLAITNGTLHGTIVKVYPRQGDTGICTKCPGNFKGKPVKGLQFIWGLKDKGNGVWDDGKLLDPKSGKIYRAKITLEGKKLYVRAYIGVSTIGRSQVWVK